MCSPTANPKGKLTVHVFSSYASYFFRGLRGHDNYLVDVITIRKFGDIRRYALVRQTFFHQHLEILHDYSRNDRGIFGSV